MATNVVAWALITFYLLASGRAFLPGLCATQAAIEAQCLVRTGATNIGPVRQSCCTVVAQSAGASNVETDDPQGNHDPVTPAESRCAFCNLLIALTDPPFSVAMTALPEPPHPQPLPAVVQCAHEVPLAAAPNRPPPA